MILDNNIENYILDLCNQAENIMPEDISITHQREILATIYNFLKIAYDNLSKEDNISHENILFIMQLLGEWIFHKGIDMKRAGIEEKYIQIIQQKIAYVIYEISQKAIKKNLSEEEIILIVEYHVKNTYNKEIKHSFNKGYIDKSVSENALHQSNIDTMPEEESDEITEENTEKEKKKDFCITINLSKCFRKIREFFGYALIILGIELLAYLIILFVK